MKITLLSGLTTVGFFDFLDFNICMQFYILLEPKNDLGKVATLFAFIADS